jgi:Flp pilus assembly protein TadG
MDCSEAAMGLTPRSNEKGTAIVELALLLPFLVTLVCGTLEMGLMYYNRQVLVNATREGARNAITNLPNKNPAQVTLDYCNANMLLFSYTGQEPLAQDAITVTYSAPNVTVSIDYTYTFLFDFLLDLDTTTIRAQTVM